MKNAAFTGHTMFIDDLITIMEAIHSDFMITDGKGVVLETSSNYQEIYNIDREEVIGMSVYELDRLKYFSPSSVAQAIKKKKSVTLRQKDKQGREYVATAIPVKDSQGTIKFVISFARDFVEFFALQEQYTRLKEKVKTYKEELQWLKEKENDTLIIKSREMLKLVAMIEKVADYDTNILITGETGVGKSLFAKRIHDVSKRAGAPFVQVNCGAIPSALIESELFGYERGAFTGAISTGKKGIIEAADGGTLFLDEVSELPLELQVKLLQTIQYKEITKVGGVENKKVDFRLISACNKDLLKLVENGSFREDLYYRLNVVSLEIPPLRDRYEDLEYLILTLLKKFNDKYNVDKKLSATALESMLSYSWPGNVRELENTMERVTLASGGTYIELEDLPAAMISQAGSLTTFRSHKLKDALEEVERKMVISAYAKTGTTVGVADTLGISQSSAARKVQKYCIPNKL